MFDQLFLEIEEILLAIVNPSNEMPLFKHCDIWNMNVEYLEQEAPFATPAVFVEFMPVEWKSQQQKTQDGVLNFKLHIVTECFGQTSSVTPEQYRLDQLQYLGFPKIIRSEIENKRLSNSSGLVRSSSIPNHNHATYIDSIEVYSCNITDSIETVDQVTKISEFNIKT